MKTNVLFLVADSLRSDVVFDERTDTPCLDRLAAEGITFSNCFSQGISTSPSMTSMLTGRYPLDYGGHRFIAAEQPTFAQEFRSRGYSTAGIHSNPHLSRARDYDKGFDHFNESILPVEPAGVFEKLPHKAILVANKIVRVLSKTPYLPAQRMNEMIMDVVDDAERPWFIWGQYMDTHGPYLPDESVTYREKFRAERLWQKAAVNSPESVTEAEHDELYTNYLNELEHLDEKISDLLAELESRGQLEDTIVIVVGDHGDEFREHGRYGHGNLPYDELTHVPLVMRFPEGFSFEGGTIVEEWARCMDILPTVLDVLPGELSDSMAARMQGESLAPTIQSSASPSFSHVVTEKQMLGKDSLRIAFRTKEWKYIYDDSEDEEYLFHLADDSQELRDVSDDDREVMQEFQNRLESRLDRIRQTSENISTPKIEEEAGVEERLRALGYKE